MRAARITEAFLITILFSSNISAAVITLPTIYAKKQKPATYSSIDYSTTKLKKSGAHSVSNLLEQQNIAKLQASSSNQSQDMISLRGFGINAADNTLFLIDDIPITDLTDSSPFINTVLFNNINQISIVPNSYGTLYGDHAVAGIVKINTSVPSTPKAIFNFGLGNLEQRQTGLYFSNRINNLGFNIGAQASNINHYIQHNNEEDYNLNTNLYFFAPHNTTSINLLSYSNLTEIPSPYIWGQGRSTNTQKADYSTLGNIAYIKNNYNPNKSFIWRSYLAIYYDKLSSEYYHSSIKENGLLWQNKINIKHNLLSGFRIVANNYDSLAGTFDNKANEKVFTAFSNLKIPVGQKIKFNIDGRYAAQGLDINRKGFAVSNQKHAVWVNNEGIVVNFNHNLYWYLRRDTNYRFVDGKDELWVDPGDWQSNILKTQTGTSYESGLHIQYKNNNLNLSAYRLQLHNELAYSILPMPYGQMSNIPHTLRQGVAIVDNAKINRMFNLNLQFNYVDPRITSVQFNNKIIPTVSEFSNGIALTTKLNKHWAAIVNTQYHGAFYPADDLNNVGVKMPGYYLTNINLQRHCRNYIFNLQVGNVFNKHYVRYAQFFVNDPARIQYYPADGINVLAGITVSLIK